MVEIHNTPWGEVHCYVLDESRSLARPPYQRHELEKEFHVSPFMDMDMHYDWRFREPGETLNVHMESFRENKKFFDATLTLRRREITGSLLNRVLWTYPPMTLKVTAMIYWQALRLRLKKAPFYAHPEKEGGRRAQTMKRSVAEQEIPSIWSREGRPADRLARRLLLQRLKNLKTGSLTLVDGDEQFTFGDPAGPEDLRVTVTVTDQRFYRSLVFGGSIGAGESYMAGYWGCDDLTALTRLVVLNEGVLLEVEGGLARLAAPAAQTLPLEK